MKTMSFVAALKDFFGLKEGQTNTDFMKEVRELTPQDRIDLTAMLGTVGYDIQTALAA